MTLASVLVGLFYVNLIACVFTALAVACVRPSRGEAVELHVALCAAVVGLVVASAWVF